MPDYARQSGSSGGTSVASSGGPDHGSGAESSQAELLRAQTKVLRQLAQKVSDLDKRLEKLEKKR